MPMTLTAPAIVKPAETAGAFEVQGFAVNASQGIIDIQYAFGEMVDGVFQQTNGTLNCHVEGAEFQSFLAANPTLYPAIKAALYALIEAQHGVTGTVV